MIIARILHAMAGEAEGPTSDRSEFLTGLLPVDPRSTPSGRGGSCTCAGPRSRVEDAYANRSPDLLPAPIPGAEPPRCLRPTGPDSTADHHSERDQRSATPEG